MEIYVYGSRSPVIILCSNDHDRNATEPLSGATVAMLSAVNPVMHAASGEDVSLEVLCLRRFRAK